MTEQYDFMQVYRDLKTHFANLKNCGLKKIYEEFIKNKAIPLNIRWDVFNEAPSDWKVHDSSIVFFEIENKLKNGEISWYDDFYVERYQTVYMSDIICRALEDSEVFTPELVEEFKEEVLAMNLESFIYDW